MERSRGTKGPPSLDPPGAHTTSPSFPPSVLSRTFPTRRNLTPSFSSIPPFLHSSKTGRPMPALGEVRRTGPDQIEDIDEFFRSPTSTNARLAPASFASLGDSPGGYEGDGDGDVGRAVEEAMERDQGMDLGSDSVGGLSRPFSSLSLPPVSRGGMSNQRRVSSGP